MGKKLFLMDPLVYTAISGRSPDFDKHLPGELMEAEYTILPACHSAHWTAFVVVGLKGQSSLSEPGIYHFDSLGLWSGAKPVTQLVEAANSKYEETRKLDLINIGSSPIQVDGYSCGPAICVFMKKLVAGFVEQLDILSAKKVSTLHGKLEAVEVTSAHFVVVAGIGNFC